MTLRQAEQVSGADYNHQGRFAEAFVSSIASAAGFEVYRPHGTGQGVDLGIYRPGPNVHGTPLPSQTIYFQVKSWSVGDVSSDGKFHYPLKVAAFNYLTANHSTPHYLALCLVPADHLHLADAGHDQLICRRAAYWLSLRGERAVTNAHPDSSRTVLVPRRHLLTPGTLRALVEGHEAQAVVS